MKKIHILTAIFTLLIFLIPACSQAHVVVGPDQVGVGSYQTFTVEVPSEKNIPTIEVLLIVPENLTSVMPNVKPGWRIETKKVGTGDSARISQIIWKGGRIPAGQRDEFSFSAKTPSDETTLTWKAYQRYSDQKVVSWDEVVTETESVMDTGITGASATTTSHDFSIKGPASKTEVVDDLQSSGAAAIGTQKGAMNTSSVSFVLSVVALVFSVIAIRRTRADDK